MWRMPANRLSQRYHLEVAVVGGPRVGSVVEVFAGAVARTPRMLPMWQGELQRLRAASEAHGLFRKWALGELGLARWDSAPMACFLERASHGEGLEESMKQCVVQLSPEARRGHRVQKQVAAQLRRFMGAML